MHFAGLRGMPRRVFTYPAEMGFDLMNLVSTAGAFILGAGFAVVAFDIIRPKRRQPLSERNPWNAGTLEWLSEMPAKPWRPWSPLVVACFPSPSLRLPGQAPEYDLPRQGAAQRNIREIRGIRSGTPDAGRR